jgi:hypothetical protein
MTVTFFIVYFSIIHTYSPRYTYGPAGRRTRSRRHALLLAPATQHDMKCDCAGIDPADRPTRARRPGSRRGQALSWPARARAPAMSDSVLVAYTIASQTTTSLPQVLIAGLHSAHPQHHTAESDTRPRPPGQPPVTYNRSQKAPRG